jgi:hypothetical protein
VLPFAPRIPSRLLGVLVLLDDPSVPIAETNRRLGAHADRMSITRPSYQRVRELVHLLRRLRRRPAARRLGCRLTLRLRTRPLELFVDHALRIGVRRLE